MFAIIRHPLCGEEVLYSLDFSKEPPGDAIPWLKQHGFELKLSCKELHPCFDQGALRLSTKHPEAGLFCLEFAKGHEVAGATRLRLTWGVTEFPTGADWEHGINRLALAVMVSFGHEKLHSGLPLGILAEPRFICAFMGTCEPAGKIYTGSLWKAGGRYLCLRPPHPSDAVTEVQLGDLYKNLFHKPDAPPVSAIGFQMNTKDTCGCASGWLKRIELLADGAKHR
jgi:hypothetical protein